MACHTLDGRKEKKNLEILSCGGSTASARQSLFLSGLLVFDHKDTDTNSDTRSYLTYQLGKSILWIGLNN